LLLAGLSNKNLFTINFKQQTLTISVTNENRCIIYQFPSIHYLRHHPCAQLFACCLNGNEIRCNFADAAAKAAAKERMKHFCDSSFVVSLLELFNFYFSSARSAISIGNDEFLACLLACCYSFHSSDRLLLCIYLPFESHANEMRKIHHLLLMLLACFPLLLDGQSDRIKFN